MEPTALAAAAVSIVAPYLAEAGKAAAKKAGEAAVSRVEAVLGAIKAKFQADQDEFAEQTLARLEAQPEAEGRRGSLADVVAEKAAADPAFAQELERQVEAAQQNPATQQFLTQVYGGTVGEIFNIGSVQTLNVGRRDDA
jgi:hypothetical protein